MDLRIQGHGPQVAHLLNSSPLNRQASFKCGRHTCSLSCLKVFSTPLRSLQKISVSYGTYEWLGSQVPAISPVCYCNLPNSSPPESLHSPPPLLEHSLKLPESQDLVHFVHCGIFMPSMVPSAWCCSNSQQISEDMR